MAAKETYKPAFDEPPGSNLAGIPIKGLQLPSPWVSYGLPYQESCSMHVRDTFHASKVFIIASGSLARNTDKLDKLVEAIGKENVVGLRKGMTSHTPWSEILSIAAECRASSADCVVTLGAGSLTDGAKLVVFVSSAYQHANRESLTDASVLRTRSASPNNLPAIQPKVLIYQKRSNNQLFPS